MSRIKKAIGALLGGITGAGVVAVLAAFGVDVTLELGLAIATILGTLGTIVAPKNAEA